MSVITTGNSPRLLQEGVKRVFGQAYAQHDKQHMQLFDQETSRKAFEIDTQWEGLGLAPVKTEGAGSAFDSQQEGYHPKYPNLTYSLGFIVTQEEMEDNLYNLFPKRSKALAFSMAQTMENVGANVYNRAFNSSYLMSGGDGVELLSTQHVRGPSDSTVLSNELAVAAALSEASLESLLIQINQAVDARGLKIAIQGQKLIVPPSLCFEAERILKSSLRVDTANNDLNAIKSKGLLPGGSVVNNYLTSTTAWFVKTNCPYGMTHNVRKAVSFEQDNDFGTSNARFKASYRDAFGWTDPRGLYGSAGV